MKNKKTMKLASRSKRLGAACLDAVIPAVIFILMLIVFAASGSRQRVPSYGYGFDSGFGYGYGYGYQYHSGMSGAGIAAVILLFLLLLAYIVVEFVFYARSKSIGKAILGLQVVSSSSGNPIGFWKMVLRECIVKSASGSVFFLGYIWILIDERNRAWHDKILDTYVVDLRETEKMYQNANNRYAPDMQYRYEDAYRSARAAELPAPVDRSAAAAEDAFSDDIPE